MSKQIKTMSQLKDSRLLYEKQLPAFGYIILSTVTILMAAVIIWSMYTPKIDVIKAAGIVQSDNKNYVMPSFSGEIFDMNIEEGLLVEKGDIMFKVKSSDINLQLIQLEEQQKLYEEKVEKYSKLVQSIKDDNNYFDISNAEDSLYYSQYEAYKSQVAQNQVDVSTYKAYGYSDEQIENQIVLNQAKITEIYYNAIQNAEAAMQEAKTQLTSIEAQKSALNEGQEEYVVTAPATGIIHMLSEYKNGMVVQAATAVASIASEQDEYTIVAYVGTQDAVRIQEGDTVDIAVSGLTQSVYGTVGGVVKKIDSDMTTSQSSDGSENSSYFKVYIEPKSTYLVSKEGNKANLSNGLSVEARIQYDEVTYFNYVLEALGVLVR